MLRQIRSALQSPLRSPRFVHTWVERVTLICCSVMFPAPSLASTEMVFAPTDSAIGRLQLAVLFPVAEPAEAATPFTLTDAMPLPPLPLSVASPEMVTFAT